MPGSWILFLTVVHTGNLIERLDGAIHGWIQKDTPTCEELRSFWNSISQSERMSEDTNEIPQIPWEIFTNSIGHHQSSENRRRKHRRPINPIRTNTLQDFFIGGEDSQSVPQIIHSVPPVEPLFVLSPSGQKTTENYGGFHGVFGDFSEPSPSRLTEWNVEQSDPFLNPTIALSGTKKKAGSETMHSPSWGKPEEVGMFGRFVDFDAPLIVSRNQPSTGEWSDSKFEAPSVYKTQESCVQVINKDCTVNEQCICAGWNFLHCVHGKCKSQHLNRDNDKEYGLWHDGPLPHSKLGLFKRLRRSNKSIFK